MAAAVGLCGPQFLDDLADDGTIIAHRSGPVPLRSHARTRMVNGRRHCLHPILRRHPPFWFPTNAAAKTAKDRLAAAGIPTVVVTRNASASTRLGTVQIVNYHRAKGREYATVIVPSSANGSPTNPTSALTDLNSTPCFVALTRARHRLVVTHSANDARTTGWQHTVQ